MRLLWARAGTPYSPATGLPIESQTDSKKADKIIEFPAGSKLLLLSPVARGKKGEFKKEIEALQRQGYQRLKIDGEMYGIEDVPALSKNIKHDIEVVVDRLVIKEGMEERLAQSLETALKLSDGIVYVENTADGERTTFSSKFACPVSGFTIEEIEPRLFSFNNPFGACPHCDGIGARLYMDPALIIPNPNLSLNKGAIAPWDGFRSSFHNQAITSLCDFLNISPATPWKDLPEKAKEIILYGSGNVCVPMYYSSFVSDKCRYRSLILLVCFFCIITYYAKYVNIRSEHFLYFVIALINLSHFHHAKTGLSLILYAISLVCSFSISNCFGNSTLFLVI